MKIYSPKNSLLNYTGVKFLPESMRKFCIEVVKATVEERERHGTVRKDLMQSMIQLRNNNDIENSDKFKLDSIGMNIKFNSFLILAPCLQLLIDELPCRPKTKIN